MVVCKLAVVVADGEMAGAHDGFPAPVDTVDLMTSIDVTADARSQAIGSLRRKRGFRGQLVSYVLVNAFLWGLWLATGGAAEQGYWPAWVSGAWGIGLAFSAWHVFGQKPISESEIEAEMSRLGRS